MRFGGSGRSGRPRSLGRCSSSRARRRRESEQTDQDRVPVEDSGGARERAEVRPERLEEVAALVQGNAAHDVTQGGAEEDGEQGASYKEQRRPRRRPT